jgi:hypothetical protein
MKTVILDQQDFKRFEIKWKEALKTPVILIGGIDLAFSARESAQRWLKILVETKYGIKSPFSYDPVSGKVAEVAE